MLETLTDLLTDLAFIWAALIAFAVLAYVILDGFDLGVGILFAVFKGADDRDQIMNSVAPVWDGNETWLVLGGGGLFAVFPLAYAIIMPALYAPIVGMLLALIFRGVAFEFRWRADRSRFVWDIAFTWGSIVATFMQGVALGALVQGIPVVGRAYSGGWWDWLTPFSLLTGVALVVGYSLLGATWLIYKTEGHLQERAYAIARWAAVGTLGLIGAVSLWTPFLKPLFRARWFAMPQMLYTAPVPILVAGCAFLLFRGLARRQELTPFLASLGLFVLCFIGLGLSFYPYIVPTSVTIWDAAGPDNSLGFLLAGAVVLVPMVLGYTAYSYWVFRGKVGAVGGYH
jgi:cytochrome bd ubiquinol oxidase subunit II